MKKPGDRCSDFVGIVSILHEGKALRLENNDSKECINATVIS